MKYMQQTNQEEEGCIFCAALTQEDGPENLVVYRGERAFVILNLYPYTSGHLMVVPQAHIASLEELGPETRAEMMELSHRAVQALQRVYQPEGINLGANLGIAAGAGIDDHIHFHVVPRWKGDTNFMSTVGETRVIPEELEETYRRLRQAWPD